MSVAKTDRAPAQEVSARDRPGRKAKNRLKPAQVWRIKSAT